MGLEIIAGICITYQGKLLLLKQSETSVHSGKWGMPAGHRENNESLVETALRETQEEAGIKVTIDGLVQSGLYIDSPNHFYFIAIFHANLKNLQPIKSDSEITNHAWVSLDELKNNKYPLRDPLLKPILIRALTETPSSVDSSLILTKT